MPKESMKDWIPLFQSLVWPAAALIIVLWNRAAIGRLVSSLAKRIEEGAPLKAGSIEIGAAPSLPTVPKEDDPRQVNELPNDIYLVHEARRDRSLDSGGLEFYRIRITLDADNPTKLDDVTSVTYRLHPTFRDPVRTVSDRKSNFELRTAGWGEFNMTAEISLKGGNKLVVERYINLPGGTA
jgi:hypothetical protein